MKKLILTFFLIILIVLLLKRTEKFSSIRGCKVSCGTKPTENDFYQCLLNDISNYNTLLQRKPTHSQAQIVSRLGDRIKNYFISLYIHGLEKDYRFVVAFVPSSYKRGFKRIGVKPVEVLTQSISMKDFMLPGYNEGRYALRPHKTVGEKHAFMKKVDYFGKKIDQVHGVFVGMGFKIAISSKSGNKNSSKCSSYETRPYRNRGYCIPGNFYNFNQYLAGGQYYDYRMLARFSRDPARGGGPKYYEKEPTKWIFKVRRNGYSGTGCGSRPEQTDLQYQKRLDSCMSTCYLRSRKGCHTAYGDSSIKEVYVVVDPSFFNLFYGRNRKQEFLNENFSSLDRFH